MKTIAFHNNKGGTGKTTLAAHTFYVAVERGLRVLACDLDTQGNLVKWLSAGDRLLEEGALVKYAKDARVLYTPDVLPEGAFKNLDVLLVDTAPKAGVPKTLHPDLWVVPIDGRMALEGAVNVAADILRSGKLAPLLLALNAVEEGGTITARALREALAQVQQGARVRIEAYPTEIPRSASIKRSGELYRPAWEVPFGARAAGTLALRGLAEHLLADIVRPERDVPPVRSRVKKKAKKMKTRPLTPRQEVDGGGSGTRSAR